MRRGGVPSPRFFPAMSDGRVSGPAVKRDVWGRRAHRRAVSLRYIEGWPVDKIAKVMSKSGPAINSLLFQGRIQLREHLGRASRFFSDASESRDPAPGGSDE